MSAPIWPSPRTGRCFRCDEPNAKGVDVTIDGQSGPSGREFCAECLASLTAQMADLRTVFDRMIAIGVPRDLANEAMMVLRRWDRDVPTRVLGEG